MVIHWISSRMADQQPRRSCRNMVCQSMMRMSSLSPAAKAKELTSYRARPRKTSAVRAWKKPRPRRPRSLFQLPRQRQWVHVTTRSPLMARPIRFMLQKEGLPPLCKRPVPHLLRNLQQSLLPAPPVKWLKHRLLVTFCALRSR